MHAHDMTLARAAAVAKALVESGVEESRIQTVGHGFDFPLTLEVYAHITV